MKYIAMLFVCLSPWLRRKKYLPWLLPKSPPMIDGHIAQDEWAGATWFTTFYQTSPDDNTTPSEKTEAAIPIVLPSIPSLPEPLRRMTKVPAGNLTMERSRSFTSIRLIPPGFSRFLTPLILFDVTREVHYGTHHTKAVQPKTSSPSGRCPHQE